MSRHTDQLGRARGKIDLILGRVRVGTTDAPKTWTSIELALKRAEAWTNTTPPREGEVGGSSSPQAEEERLEHAKVVKMAAKALQRIPELVASVEKQMDELYSTVQRLTATVDPSKAQDVPGCLSCARSEGKLGRHFAPVYDKAPGQKLCRWCWDHRSATGRLPLVEACDIYHRQGPRSAGLWLAKRERSVA